MQHGHRGAVYLWVAAAGARDDENGDVDLRWPRMPDTAHDQAFIVLAGLQVRIDNYP